MEITINGLIMKLLILREFLLILSTLVPNLIVILLKPLLIYLEIY